MGLVDGSASAPSPTSARTPDSLEEAHFGGPAPSQLAAGASDRLPHAATAQTAMRLEFLRPEELAQGFEFKILRANTNAFRKPEVLRRALEEVARAGWALGAGFMDGSPRSR